MLKLIDVTHHFLKRYRLHYVVPAFAITGFSIWGALLLTATHAATPFVATEPEIGSRTGLASVVADATASNGSSIKFNALSPSRPPAFVHPGIHLNRPQLDFVKAHITQEPWLSAYNKAKSSTWANLSRVPAPVPSVQCGNGSGTPLNIGCSQELGDAAAAYNDALLWYYSGNQAYANKAIELMNAWSSTLVEHKWDGTSTYGNDKLQAGWAGANWTRAAEIIRYSNAGWTSTEITKFEGMLNNAYLPLLIDGWTGGGFNWLMLFADVTMSIGVFTNNQATFDNGLGDWRTMVPAHIFMSTDGPTPHIPAGINQSNVTTYWFGATTFMDGQTQETCRDLGHTAMGLASIFTAAETARIQGIDLYGEQQARLMAALEFESSNWTQIESKIANPAYVIPSSICGGVLHSGATPDVIHMYTGEIALNHYVNRMHLSLPKTQAWVLRSRPLPYGTINLHMQDETLTNADSGSVPAQ